MSKIAIAIDGPSGAGKSTVARAAAEALGYIYVDTGALYRALGLYIFRAGIDKEQTAEICAALREISIDIRYDTQKRQRVLLCGEDVSDQIRTPQIAQYASAVSAIPEVRQFLLQLQREMAQKYNVIMDGRDIGTVILPDATVKIYLTASIECRAKRRYEELCAKGQTVTLEGVTQDITRRDERDSSRQVAPLKMAEDAVLLDTSALSLEESIRAALALIQNVISGRIS